MFGVASHESPQDRQLRHRSTAHRKVNETDVPSDVASMSDSDWSIDSDQYEEIASPPVLRADSPPQIVCMSDVKTILNNAAFPRSDEEFSDDDDEPGIVIPSDLFDNNNNNWSYNRYHSIQSLLPPTIPRNESQISSQNIKSSKPMSDFHVITEILQDINLDDSNSLKDLIQLKQALLSTLVKVDSKISDIQERLEEQILCVICQERHKEVTLDPCGHMTSCSTCTAALSLCPICRMKPQKFLRTFWS